MGITVSNLSFLCLQPDGYHCELAWGRQTPVAHEPFDLGYAFADPHDPGSGDGPGRLRLMKLRAAAAVSTAQLLAEFTPAESTWFNAQPQGVQAGIAKLLRDGHNHGFKP